MNGSRRVTWTAIVVVVVGLLAFLTGCGLIAAGGVLGVSALARDDSQRSAPPKPAFVLTPLATQVDRVPISYRLSGPTNFDLKVEFSINGASGPFLPATEALEAPTEGTRNLTASSGIGTPHVFVWNAFFDLDAQNVAVSSNVVFRITAFDPTTGVQFGDPGLSNPFTVDNRLFTTIAGQLSTDAEGQLGVSVPLLAPTQAIVRPDKSILVVDTGNSRIRLVDGASRLSVTFAGGAGVGFAGDGTPASVAKVFLPGGIALDPDQNVVFTDSGNHRIRRVDVQGIVATIAGTGSASLSGDGGSALAATLNNPTGIVIDAQGNIFFSDTGNHVVRMITPGGTVTTVAGTGTAGSTGDGGPALQARLSSPRGLGIDERTKTIYVADSGNHAVRAFTIAGNMSTVAGILGVAGLGDENVLAAGSPLSGCSGVVVLSDSIIVADTNNNRLRSFSPGGRITTIAGSISGQSGFTGDNGAATTATLNGPTLLALDGAGGIIVADTGNNRIRQIDVNGQITTVVGSGVLGASVGDGGPAAQARVGVLRGQLSRGADGTILMAEVEQSRVRAFTMGGSINTIAGQGFPSLTVSGAPAVKTPISFAAGLDADLSGVVIIGNTQGGSILSVNPTDGTLNVLASAGVIREPRAVLCLAPPSPLPGRARIALIADTAGNAIFRLPYQFTGTVGLGTAIFAGAGQGTGGGTGGAGAGNITRICGTGVAGFSPDGTAATDALLSGPSSLATDGTNVYFADTGNNVVRRFSFPSPAAPNTTAGPLVTVAGTPGSSGYAGDGGPATSALLSAPSGVAFDAASGSLFVCDRNNHVVRRIDAQGIITTFAGNGLPGDAGIGGPPLAANFTSPTGITIDPETGAVLVACSGVNRILQVRNGVVTSVAGVGPAGSIGEGGAATSATLDACPSVAVAPDGTIYILDVSLNRIRKIDPKTRIITNVIGNGVSQTAPEGASASSAGLAEARSIAIDANGNVYFSELGTNTIRVVDTSGNVRTVVGRRSSGTGRSGPGAGNSGDGGPALQARLNGPNAIAIAPTSQKLYWTESGGAVIRVYDPVTQLVNRVLGGGVMDAENVPATAAGTADPQALVIDEREIVYYTEGAGGGNVGASGSTNLSPGAVNHRVRKFQVVSTGTATAGQLAVTGNVLTIAGLTSSSPGFNGDGILATNAVLNSPRGITVDPLGNVFFSDSFNQRIRRIDAASGFITTVVGTGIAGYGPNNVAPGAALIQTCVSLVMDKHGYIYATHQSSPALFRFRPFP